MLKINKGIMKELDINNLSQKKKDHSDKIKHKQIVSTTNFKMFEGINDKENNPNVSTFKIKHIEPYCVFYYFKNKWDCFEINIYFRIHQKGRLHHIKFSIQQI